ncbi:MAG: hypothetical protein Q4G34_01445 [Micrococcus sp.]|nr:hypothetical protein [Micrococcus sp.]
MLIALAALIGIGMVWHEQRFYGRLPWAENPPLAARDRMGHEGRALFRDALRELRHALEHDRAEDAAGWVIAARRRGWWIAEIDAAASQDKQLGLVMRQVSARRADLERRLINIEDTGVIGTLKDAKRSAEKVAAARDAARQPRATLTPEQWARVREDAATTFGWAQRESAAVIEVHAADPRLRERLTEIATAPVHDDELASWDDWETTLLAWGQQKTAHHLRVHRERPPLPAYATKRARRLHQGASTLRAQAEAARALDARSAGTQESADGEAVAEGSTSAGAASSGWARQRARASTPGRVSPTVLARRRKQARTLHEEMTLKVAQYDLDFDLQLTYPQFHNRDIPEVRAMDGAARRAADEWDLIHDIPDRRLTPQDVVAYRDAVDAFKQAVLAADARVRLIGDAGITDDELRDLETARGLFRHLADPANPASLRDTYRARLVQILNRLNSRPGTRVSFTPDALLALEGGAG